MTTLASLTSSTTRAIDFPVSQESKLVMTCWCDFVRAAQLSPGWAIERTKRFGASIVDRTERNRYEIAARSLRIAAFGHRIDWREDERTNYRDKLLAKHKAKQALVPLIRAMR